MRQVVPADSRYIPFTQQKSCCVPTCLLMIMYRHGLPLLPAEKLGYHLGLVVPPDREELFYHARVAAKMPKAGYGTRIYLPRYEPNKVFRQLGIPLSFKIYPISLYKSLNKAMIFLLEAEKADQDIVLCFNHGALVDDPTLDWGHVCLFDRFINDRVRIVDPSNDQPKWRLVSLKKLYFAMRKHGEEKAGGFWLVEKSKA